MKNPYIILSITAAVLFSCVSCIGGDDNEVKNHVVPGMDVPQFEVSPPTSAAWTSFKSPADFDSRKSLLVLFSATCGDCHEAMPKIEEAWKDFIVDNQEEYCLLNIARQLTAETAEYWANEEFTMPYYLDPDRAVFNLFANMTVPRMYFIGTDGKIKEMWIEETGFTAAQVIEKLKKLE